LLRTYRPDTTARRDRVVSGCGAVESPRRGQVVIACDDAFDASADAAGRAELDRVFALGHDAHLCADDLGDQIGTFSMALALATGIAHSITASRQD
jgi:hypothetical protein